MSPPQSRPNSTIPNKPQESYPTPTVRNKLVPEFVPMEVGSYQLLEYGSLYEDAEHSPFSKDYTGYILVSQQPAFDNNAWWMRRTWAAPWVGQSDWNYSFEYISGDPNYPIVQRVETVLRDSYTPAPPLTPDVAYPGALLTEEKMINTTNPEDLHSKFVQVVKTFSTIPGPIVTTQDFDTQLNVLVYTDKQLVLYTDIFNTAANPLTLEMKESDQSKYVKLRVRSYLQALPDPFTQYRTGRYEFPALITDVVLDLYQWTVVPDRSQVYWYPIMRGVPNVPALFKVTTSYFTAEPTTETLFVVPSGNFYYNGTSYNISIPNVLNDEIEVQATFVDDAQYGDLDEPHTFPATTLSATAYTALIGTYQKVACDITRWRGSIFTKVVQEVLIV